MSGKLKECFDPFALAELVDTRAEITPFDMEDPVHFVDALIIAIWFMMRESELANAWVGDLRLEDANVARLSLPGGYYVAPAGPRGRHHDPWPARTIPAAQGVQMTIQLLGQRARPGAARSRVGHMGGGDARNATDGWRETYGRWRSKAGAADTPVVFVPGPDSQLADRAVENDRTVYILHTRTKRV